MDRIERLLLEWEPKLRDAFLAAVRGIRARVQLAEVVRLLKAGDVDGAVRAVGLDPMMFRPLGQALEAMYEAGGQDAIAAVRTGRVGLVFDVKGVRASAWLSGYTSDLIRQITEDQRQLVREAMSPLSGLSDPMATGQTPQKIALDLVGRVSRVTGRREGGLIGLTSQQATWARNYETELTDVPDANALTRKLRDRRFDKIIAKAIRENRPIAADKRDAMVAAYRNRALRYRAETIALNEASTSLHEAQVEAWRQAVERGAVQRDRVRRMWVTAQDDHVRPTHREVPGMNEGGVGLEQPFQTYKGPVMQPGWRFDPGCRCRVRVRVLED